MALKLNQVSEIKDELVIITELSVIHVELNWVNIVF